MQQFPCQPDFGPKLCCKKTLWDFNLSYFSEISENMKIEKSNQSDFFAAQNAKVERGVAMYWAGGGTCPTN